MAFTVIVFCIDAVENDSYYHNMSYPLSLRERKKALTRTAIQQAALELFQRQGYTATTTIQIAAAARVSPATFFRYFQTKEDVVFFDAMDFIMHDNGQPPASLSPIAAIRWMLTAAFDALTPEQREQQRQRYALIGSVPELRAHLAAELTKSTTHLAAFFAKRTGSTAQAAPVRILAGATIGVILTALLTPTTDYVAALKHDLSALEARMK